MALDCYSDEIMGDERSMEAARCNPQEDSRWKGPRFVVEPAPWPTESEDLPPWSQLEQLKKEANEVAMHSFPSDDLKAKITVISGNAAGVNSRTMSTTKEDLLGEESSIVDDDVPAAFFTAPSNSFSEYTSFAKATCGYVYQIKSRTHSEGKRTISSSKPPNEGQEHTVENFNQFLELSSMTANSCDHEAVMGTRNHEQQHRESCDEQRNHNHHTLEKPSKVPLRLWPDVFKAPEMKDAPSGILLVFDRMLDCIDPGVTRQKQENGIPNDGEYVCGYETDQSSSVAISLPVSPSWLLSEFGDISITGSTTTDDEGSRLLSGSSKPQPLGAEWLDESLDCIFPCWKDPPVQCGNDDDEAMLPLKPRPSPQELADAIEACRKRNWAAVEDPNEEESEEESSEAKDELELEEIDTFDEVGVQPKPSGESRESEPDPFDFPIPDFPPPVWKKPDPVGAEAKDVLELEPNDDADSASGSSLSELFPNMVFGTPYDEKDEGHQDLHRFMNQTSVTEETSTLSYSDGTI